MIIKKYFVITLMAFFSSMATNTTALEVGDDGLHKTKWMQDTFKDFAVHGWQLLPDFLPEAKRSTAALGDWVRIRLGLQRA